MCNNNTDYLCSNEMQRSSFNFFPLFNVLKATEPDTSNFAITRVLLTGDKPDELLTPLVGLIEYSEGTLSVFMLCLGGLFNSANRHKNARVSHCC